MNSTKEEAKEEKNKEGKDSFIENCEIDDDLKEIDMRERFQTY